MPSQTPSKIPKPPGRAFLPGLFFGLVVLVLLVELAFTQDAVIRSHLLAEATPGRTELARMLSRYGDWPWLAGPVLAAWLWAKHRKRAALKELLGLMLLTFLLAGGIGLVIRVTTGRARPSTTSAQGWHGLKRGDQWLVGVPDFNSFPSGHTTAAAGMVGSLVFARRRWGWATLLLPVSIGWSRMALDRHHFSDVVAGLGLGLLAGWVVWRWKRRAEA